MPFSKFQSAETCFCQQQATFIKTIKSYGKGSLSNFKNISRYYFPELMKRRSKPGEKVPVGSCWRPLFAAYDLLVPLLDSQAFLISGWRSTRDTAFWISRTSVSPATKRLNLKFEIAPPRQVGNLSLILSRPGSETGIGRPSRGRCLGVQKGEVGVVFERSAGRHENVAFLRSGLSGAPRLQN